MSKRSERNAQIQKIRSAVPSQGNRTAEGAGPSASNPRQEARKRRKPLPRRLYWTLIAALILIGVPCLSGLVSVVLSPEVIPPPPLLPNIAPSIQIVNRSFLSLKSVEYSCALASVADQSGFSMADSSGATPEIHTTPSLPHGDKVPLDCQAHLDARGVRIRTANSLVKVSYFHPGWPFRRHSEYRLQGEFDQRGFPMRWVVN